MPEPVRVTTLTVGTDEATWLEGCLGSLLDTNSDGIDLTVTLLDNASTDGTAELVRGLIPAVAVTSLPARLGFAAANNVGIRRAVADGADYVFLVNPDTRTPPDLIEG